MRLAKHFLIPRLFGLTHRLLAGLALGLSIALFSSNVVHANNLGLADKQSAVQSTDQNADLSAAELEKLILIASSQPAADDWVSWIEARLKLAELILAGVAFPDDVASQVKFLVINGGFLRQESPASTEARSLNTSIRQHCCHI